MRRSNWLGRDLVLPVVALFSFFVVWEGVVRVFNITSDTLPPPTQCFRALINPKLYEVSNSSLSNPIGMAVFHFLSSITRVLLALLAVSILAIPIAIVFEAFIGVRVAFTPLFSALASVTPIVWIVLAIRMPFFESEFAAPAFVILAASIFLMSISISQQFQSVPQSLRNLGQRLGANGWKCWRSIIFPYSAPELLHLFRVQFLFGLAIVPFVEVSGAQYGIGQLIYKAKQGSNVSLALGLIILLAATGFAIDFIFRKIEATLFEWSIERK